MEWFALDEEKRIKDVYGKFSIKRFWDWWSRGEDCWMEVRIRDINIIRQLGDRYKFHWSASGVFVNSADDLRKTIAFCREKAVMWFGVNPRKKFYKSNGKYGFEGKDYFVDSISYIFLDIDRKKKDAPATNDELHNADILAEKILEQLGKYGWNKSYCKLCSGNGVQLLIALDVPIKMPSVDAVVKEYGAIYEPSESFEHMKNVLKKGIGHQISLFSRASEEQLGVDIDTSCFNIGRVASLPFTKNYKYGGFTWRGIIEMKDGTNEGLSDYVLQYLEDKKIFVSLNKFPSSQITTDKMAKKGKVAEHPLIEYMLTQDIPEGMRNNYLWFSIKLLLKDSGIDFQSDEVRKIHREIEERFKDKFPLNIPDKNRKFSEATVNSFCLKNKIPLVYPYMSHRRMKREMKLEGMKWEMKDMADGVISLPRTTDIMEDMENIKSQLTEGSYKNKEIISMFINACIVKYGEKDAKYYFDNIFYRYFTYL